MAVLNVTDPEQFTRDAIAAIQRQLDAGHLLVSGEWGADKPAKPRSGCALTLVAFDLHGVEETCRAFADAEGDGEDTIAPLYATAGQSGSHRIVSALRAIEAWLREGGAL